MTLKIDRLTRTERFEREFRRLSPDLQRQVASALTRLLAEPIPRALRHHTLSSTDPRIHKIDINPQHTHQVTFLVEGTVARLLRVASHKEIDRLPG